MAWSTRQLAELAGTSLRTVRHYHEVGLLAEPGRKANGYKEYGVAHLVRLLRVKRLTGLGFSLSQIAAMGPDEEHPAQALRVLDAEVAATIERLQRVRVELGLILRGSAPADLPAELAVAAAEAELSQADRAFLLVTSRVVSPEAVAGYRRMLEGLDRTPGMAEFDDLDPDADEVRRQDLARRLAPQVRALREANPGLGEVRGDDPADRRFLANAWEAAMRDLYNEAQRDVMKRVNRLIAESDG